MTSKHDGHQGHVKCLRPHEYDEHAAEYLEYVSRQDFDTFLFLFKIEGSYHLDFPNCD